jgi:hypothetical protein
MIILACNIQGVLVFQPVPQGQTVNEQHYVSFLQYHVYGAVRERHPDLFENGSILHSNATTRSADTVKNARKNWGWKVLHYFPYSPDLSSCDYVQFPKLNHPLHGKQFANREDILTAV